MGVNSQTSGYGVPSDKPEGKINIKQQERLGFFLRALLASLMGLFVTGVGMVAIGQPTASHVISSSGNAFWHTLFVIHMVFLAGITINALLFLGLAISSLKAYRKQAIIGFVVITLGSICGSLAFQDIHPALFLFFVAMSFIVLGAIYGPLLGRMLAKNNK